MEQDVFLQPDPGVIKTSSVINVGSIWGNPIYEKRDMPITVSIEMMKPLILDHISDVIGYLTVAGLAQSVERLTAEREVAGSIPGAGPLLRVLKWLRNEGTSFALQAARPSRGSDDHVKCRFRLH